MSAQGQPPFWLAFLRPSRSLWRVCLAHCTTACQATGTTQATRVAFRRMTQNGGDFGDRADRARVGRLGLRPSQEAPQTSVGLEPSFSPATKLLDSSPRITGASCFFGKSVAVQDWSEPEPRRSQKPHQPWIRPQRGCPGHAPSGQAGSACSLQEQYNPVRMQPWPSARQLRWLRWSPEQQKVWKHWKHWKHGSR